MQPTDPGVEFTRFSIELYEDITVIKVADSEVGLYVDPYDGWKVKATNQRGEWSKCAFKVRKFLPQYNTLPEAISEDVAQRQRMNLCCVCCVHM